METTPYHEPIERYFIDCCRTKLVREYLPKIIQSIEPLTEEDIWWRAHETNNSIGNLMLHLSGNIRQWVVQHLGGKDFRRDRPAEFADRGSFSKQKLIDQLSSAVAETDSVLAQCAENDLRTLYTIQKYQVTGLEAILHITEHFSYHVGQIIYISKLRTGKDLKFYDL